LIPIQRIKLIKNMNGHGGKRNGSGRKKGSPTERTREVADRLAVEEITPLQVMIEVMLKHRAAGRDDKAAAVARDAAPYMHSKLSYVKSDVSFPDAAADSALDAELEELATSRQATGADAAQGQDESGEPPHPRRNGRGPVAGTDSS
jgi:hypothetical protein